MGTFTVTIQPLTPIWTGDAKRNCTTLRETGIIGSLRWWYEALIRGLGGTACDPTNTKCEGKNHCDACEFFGCTGWARKFRFEIENCNLKEIKEILIETREMRNNKYLKRKISGLMSNDSIVLNFIPLKDISQNEWGLLNRAFEIIANYGALGARTSQGNGVIKIIENRLPYNDTCKVELNKFFFYKFHLKFKENLSNLIGKNVFWTQQRQSNCSYWKEYWENYKFLPIAFHIRDAIRHLESDRNQRHEIFGTVAKYARGSKVFVSHGYKIDDKTVETRIWGYEIPINILNCIKSNLNANLRIKLFQTGKSDALLENCTVKEEIIGKELK